VGERQSPSGELLLLSRFQRRNQSGIIRPLRPSLFQSVPDGLDVFVHGDWLAGRKEEYSLILPVFFYVNDVDRIHINIAPSAFELHEFHRMAPQRWEPEI
jgi:hypothetical protein